MPVRDEEASDIFSELVPQVLQNTEGRDEVTNRLVRRAFVGLVYTLWPFNIKSRSCATCMSSLGA